MHTNIFEKHDAVDVAGAAVAVDVAGAAVAADVAGAAVAADVAGAAVAAGVVDTVAAAGGQPVKSPHASTRVRRRGYGRVVGERRDSMASGRVDDSGVEGHVSPGGVDGKDSSDDGGSRSVGIGRRFTEPRPIGIPPKLYRIGEIVEHSGLSRQTIHNYTTMGLLVEVRRTDGGHRLYDELVFDRLNGIMALKAQHKSLAYIREYYAKSGAG